MQINEEVTYKFDCILVTLEQVVMIFNMKISRRQLDGCIVWYAHNTLFSSKLSAICAQAVYFLHSQARHRSGAPGYRAPTGFVPPANRHSSSKLWKMAFYNVHLYGRDALMPV